MNPSPEPSEPIHVLFVEDDVLVSEWVAGVLSAQGYAVHTETNAAGALRHLASYPVDVLVTDINLPGDMDGTALAQRARELVPTLPVIYASARVGALQADARVPGSIIVPKPYEPAFVGRLLAAALKSAAAAVPA